ncbi:hypothetical protein ACFQ4L_03890 [Lapidilactobacillus mulanensis]|uniref:Uncharacterized protein n=1 Tax=Lapidilactobacillus mulanensis TaxID=2485999 RepID=A0ABW4DKM0_9LACO|nr:hypothetical protein [Lapidilactobacillus mulanensis]
MKDNREPDTIIETRKSGGLAAEPNEPQQPENEPHLSRVARKQAQRTESEDPKSVRHPLMRRRLNWAIAAVVLLIVVVYLVLFFV